jgi:hypothetical protein
MGFAGPTTKGNFFVPAAQIPLSSVAAKFTTFLASRLFRKLSSSIARGASFGDVGLLE